MDSQNLGTFLGVPMIRTIVFGRLFSGSPILGYYREASPIVPEAVTVQSVGGHWKPCH